MIKKTICIMLLLVFALNLFFPLLTNAAEETITIQFEDENFYKEVVKQIEKQIETSHDSDLTITIKQSNLDEIKSFSISDKNISNIKGISAFKNLKSLCLHKNLIEDVSDLGQLINLELLDLSSNRITDISPLSNLTNLKELYLGFNGSNSGGGWTIIDGGYAKSSNMISDIQPLGALTKLEVLDIVGVGLKDISVLHELVNLKVLDLACNEIEDITALENLNNLYCLSLHGNVNIKNFQPISTLTALTKLSLVNTKLSDISFVSNLTKMKTLNLSYNNISDLTPLSNLSDLRSITIGDNPNLEDLSPLSQCLNLVELCVPYNNIRTIDSFKDFENLYVCIAGDKIDNLSVMDQSSLKFSDGYTTVFELDHGYSGSTVKKHPQLLEIETTDNEVPLPSIFIQAQNPDSKIYSEQGFRLQNCAFNEGKDKVIIDDNVSEATVTIQGGKIEGSKFTIKHPDIIPPEIQVNYSTTEMTRESVTATILSNEALQEVEGWTLSTDKTRLTKIYAKNTEEIIPVYDLAGNESKATISIKNIDTTAPQADISYSTTILTNQNVIATISANEKIQNIDGWILSDDKTTITKEYDSNTTEDITIYDLVGNGRKININISNIDKKAPIANINYSTLELTNKNVEVTITADEEINAVDGWILSSDHKKLVKEYKENIENEKIIISDLAGNNSEVEITIANIDKIPPQLEVSYSTTSENSNIVTVQIKANEKVKKAAGWTLNNEQNILTKEFNINITDEVEVYDLAGNGNVQKFSISSIKEIDIVNSEDTKNKGKEDQTIAPNKLPYTGKKLIIATIGFCAIILTSAVIYKKYDQYKDVK